MPVELCLSLTADSTKSGLQVLYTGEATHVMKSQSHLATSVHVQYALIIEEPHKNNLKAQGRPEIERKQFQYWLRCACITVVPIMEILLL